MRAFKIILGIAAALIICVVILALFAQREDALQNAKWAHEEAAQKAEEQRLLPSVELFDLGLGEVLPDPTDEGHYWVREIHGRARNKSPKSLRGLAIKISIIDSNSDLIDTSSAFIHDLGAAPGDVKSFSSEVDVRRIPKGFKWQYQITDLTFY